MARVAQLLEAYVDECASRMRLGYEINVRDPQPRSNDYYLSIDRDHFGTRTATITIGRWFPKLRKDRKRLVVAHELGHLIAWDYTETIGTVVGVESPIMRFVDRAEEEFCDRLAAAIAPLLPPWGDT